MTIHQAIWLFPACVAVHFAEEATGFAKWATYNISTRYTEAHWRRIHGTGMLFALAATVSMVWWMRPVTTFMFTALFLTPMVFNALFQAAASVHFRSYSPGTASAVALFPALCWYLVSQFSVAGLLQRAAISSVSMLWCNKQLIDFADLTTKLIRPEPNQQCIPLYLPVDLQDDRSTPTGIASEGRPSGTHIVAGNRQRAGSSVNSRRHISTTESSSSDRAMRHTPLFPVPPTGNFADP